MIAALLHDIANIQMKGIHARTNFRYSAVEILCILDNRSILTLSEQIE